MDAATADLGDLGEDFYGDQSYDDEELSSLEGIEGVDDWWQNQSLLIDKIRNWHI